MLIDMSRNQHMADSIDEVDGDARRQWRVVNSLLHPVVIPPGWASTSEYFNNKITKIHEEVGEGSVGITIAVHSPVIFSPERMNVFTQVSIDEVTRMISGKTSKAGRTDYIRPV